MPRPRRTNTVSHAKLKEHVGNTESVAVLGVFVEVSKTGNQMFGQKVDYLKC